MADIVTGGDQSRRLVDMGDGTYAPVVSVVTGTAVGVPVVNTELPAAAAMGDTDADTLAVPAVAARLQIWTGSAFIRVAAAGSAQDAVASDSTLYRIRTTPHNYVYNGATWDRERTPNVFKPQSAVAIGTEATVWTPGAGKKFRLMGGIISVGTLAGDVVFRDNTAGTTIAVISCVPVGESVAFDFGNGILSATANNVLTADGPAASTLSGTLWGTEE